MDETRGGMESKSSDLPESQLQKSPSRWAASLQPEQVSIEAGVADVSETDLFNQTFSLDAPKAGAPRFRLMNDAGSKTYESLTEGDPRRADWRRQRYSNEVQQYKRFSLSL